MKIAKYLDSSAKPRAGLIDGDSVRPVDRSLTEWLQDPPRSPDAHVVGPPVPIGSVRLLAPLDRQEIWAAGVTYLRSKVAREEESTAAASFYDLVYQADRPELFLKSTPGRTRGPGDPLRVRSDSAWSVPEPELALVVTPDRKLAGFTIGNDMSARDIEGRNPLYLPQAKIYRGSCSIGPWITLADAMPGREAITIRMSVTRGDRVVFDGETSADRIVRSNDELIDWLFRENEFPDGVVLLTGTGIVPPDDFHLRTGDRVLIDISGIGELENAISDEPPPAR
jgi:2-dehydro-3-deoxy-D-arabinonate dehydratase